MASSVKPLAYMAVWSGGYEMPDYFVSTVKSEVEAKFEEWVKESSGEADSVIQLLAVHNDIVIDITPKDVPLFTEVRAGQLRMHNVIRLSSDKLLTVTSVTLSTDSVRVMGRTADERLEGAFFKPYALVEVQRKKD